MGDFTHCFFYISLNEEQRPYFFRSKGIRRWAACSKVSGWSALILQIDQVMLQGIDDHFDHVVGICFFHQPGTVFFDCTV